VVLLNLGKLRPPAAFPARVAHLATPMGEGRAYYVAAMPVVHKADAFTAAPVGSATNPDLVNLAALGAGGD